ncbi:MULTISPECIES: hypothetical protein [unclassified Inquilinus]|uniref:hypothetical protein n=1 Tax=unclassified Inquilinus TaxID=2645927 RepID=UPI003F9370F3
MLPLLAKTYALAGALAAPGRTRRIMRLKNRHAGERCFLLGNAPSLVQFDLSKLAGEQFFVVKKGYKALEHGLPSPIPYYVLSDLRGWDRIKADVSTLPVGTYLVRDTIAAQPEFQPPADRVVTFPSYRGGLRKQGFRHQPWHGLGNDSTVILFAAQIAHYLGFAEVYILGVDLDYSQATTYFYAAGQSETNQYARPEDEIYAREFGTLRQAFDADGRILRNVGRGGAVMGLERADYDAVLAQPKPGR